MMYLLHAAVLIAALWVCIMPVHAQNQIYLNTPQEQGSARTAGIAYLPVAKLFGCNKFANGVYTSGPTITLEYIPSTDDINKWMRLMTITVYPLLNDTPDTMEMVISNATKILQTKGRLIQTQRFQDTNNYPRMFVAYETNDPLVNGYSSGTLYRVRPGIAAFAQIQTHDISVAATDAERMKLFAKSELNPLPTH